MTNPTSARARRLAHLYAIAATALLGAATALSIGSLLGPDSPDVYMERVETYVVPQP